MATTCLLLLAIISLLLFGLAFYQLAMIVLVLFIILYLLLGTGCITAILLKCLHANYLNLSSPQWKEKNVILLFGGSTIQVPGDKTILPTQISYSRIFRTAKLYFSCLNAGKKCIIIISGGDRFTPGMSEAAVYANECMSLGIPVKDIILEKVSRNTFENAKYCSQILKLQSFDEVYLVTSGILLKRAQLYLSYFDIKVVPAPADYIEAFLWFIPSGYNFAMADFAVNEFVGIMRFHIYNWFGWNKKHNNENNL